MNEKSLRLTVQQKIEMINYQLSNPKTTQVQIAAKFAKEYGLSHISKQTISRIFDKQMVKKLLNVEVVSNSPIKNIRECQHPELERCLFVWFSQIQHNVILSDKVLTEKAKEFGEMLGICEQTFKYSNGWLEKFKKRHGITLKTLSGEAGSVDLNLVERERLRLKTVLSEYESKNRFNYDETAIFYKLQPNRTLGTSSRSSSINEIKLSRLKFMHPEGVSINESSLYAKIKYES